MALPEKTLPIKDFKTDIPKANQQMPDGVTTLSWHFPKIITRDAKGNDITTDIYVEVKNVNGAVVPLKAEWLEFGARMPDGLVTYIYTDVVNTKTEKKREAKPRIVLKGKNIGRANETNTFTQALSEARGIYNKKMQLITVIADDKKTTTIKRYPPMLVSKADLGTSEMKMPERDAIEVDFTKDVFFQPKLNGIRAVVVGSGGDDILIYGRSMKDILGNTQIKNAFKVFMIVARELVKEIVYFDCEIYSHGMSLQEISGEARKEKDAGSLKAYVFDLFIPERPTMTFIERYALLENIFKRVRTMQATSEPDKPTVVLVPTVPVVSKEAAITKYKTALSEGYEGGILRYGDLPYQYSYNGYHSRNILKMKPLLSSEFEVCDFTAAEKGKAAGNIVLICCIRDAAGNVKKTFNVTFKDMTEDAQKAMYKKWAENDRRLFNSTYKGKPVTLDYYELSKDGVPLMAKAVAIRDYE